MATDILSQDALPWELRGHERARELLRDLPASSLLLSGPEGVGRRQLARWYGALLNCERPGTEPCAGCASCLLWHGGHPDYLEVAPAATTTTGRLNRRPEVRISQLVPREGASGEPLYTWLERRPLHKWRVGVIDSAHQLTVAAANSFLKMLEEPPSWVKIVLIAPEPGALLPTVASRLTAIRLGTVNTAGMEPAEHPAHILGTPGPLERAHRNQTDWQDAISAVAAYVSALHGNLNDAFEAATDLEPVWLGKSVIDVPQLLRAEIRRLAPDAWAAADGAIARSEDNLASYVSAQVALQLLTLELRELLSS